jgi:hypothetical protein
MAKIVEMMKEIMVTIITANAAALWFPAPSSLLTLTLDTTYRKNVFNKKILLQTRDLIESWITDLAAALKPTEIMNNNPKTVILHQKN